ncbi:MAG: SDR family oxidoreductase, partial [Shimia sp.]|nr:SDR family oxidoreductase [Shimia sp.]
ITFNSICPAYVETAIIDENIESIMARTGCSEEEARHMMVGVNPHGRLIQPEEVANTALYLCSDLADSVRGQTLQVAGGEM